jgi:hypothetical protein
MTSAVQGTANEQAERLEVTQSKLNKKQPVRRLSAAEISKFKPATPKPFKPKKKHPVELMTDEDFKIMLFKMHLKAGG